MLAHLPPSWRVVAHAAASFRFESVDRGILTNIYTHGEPGPYFVH